jgi:hypothetical protein
MTSTANAMGALRKLISQLRGTVVRQPPNSVFDTAADRPRNLDDPFSDPKAQARVAQLIAEKGSKAAKT